MPPIVTAFCILLSSGCAVTSQRGVAADEAKAIPLDTAMSDRPLLSEYTSASGKICRRYKDTAHTGLIVRCLSESGQWQNVRQLSGIYSKSRIASLMLETNKNRGYETASILPVTVQPTNASGSYQDQTTFEVDTTSLHGESVHSDEQGLEAVVLASGREPLIVPFSTPEVVDEANDHTNEHTAATSIEVTVQPDESLWSLSKRVTGSGSHWTEIAQFNQLKDGNSIFSGQQILVPRSLVQ